MWKRRIYKQDMYSLKHKLHHRLDFMLGFNKNNYLQPALQIKYSYFTNHPETKIVLTVSFPPPPKKKQLKGRKIKWIDDGYLCVCSVLVLVLSVDAWEREPESLRNRRRASAASHSKLLCTWVSPQGVRLYACSDMAHKQPRWGIKCKDLDGENGVLVYSSAEFPPVL